MDTHQIYKNTAETYIAMLDACKNAQSEILFQQYIFEDCKQGIGADFLKVFTEKAKNGVRVALYIDALGSLQFYRDIKLQKTLVDCGVEINFYKHAKLASTFTFMGLFLRNHIKLMVVDQQQTWMGGIVVGEKYKSWDDLTVCIEDKEIGRQMAKQITKQIIHLNSAKKTITFPPTTLSPTFSVVGNTPGFKNRYFTHSIKAKIKSAKSNITIVTPYFSPPSFVWKSLKLAMKRGVKVHLIIPKDTDHEFINTVHQGFYEKLLKLGCKIQLQSKMMHGKLVIIDNAWATFGSTNFDALSLLYNYELNISVTDKGLINLLQNYVLGLNNDGQILNKLPFHKSLFKNFKIKLFRIFRNFT